MTPAPITLKLGGTAGAHSASVDMLAERAAPGWVIVHGGGSEVGAWSRRLGLKPSTIDGLRVTDDPTLEVAVAVLRGLANARLVAALAAGGVRAIGLSGVDADLFGVQRFDERLGWVGRVERVDTELLDRLAADGLVPVVAPIARDGENLLNVNADEAAGAIAAARGGRLVLLTDVPGLRRGEEVVASLDADAASALIDDGTAEGGMRPKLAAAIAAARAGCTVTIADGTDPSAVRAVLDGVDDIGTTITAGPRAARIG